MDALAEEFQLLQRVLYKTKNAHHTSKHYQHLRHVYRLIERLLRKEQRSEIESRLSGAPGIPSNLDGDIMQLMDMSMEACDKAFISLHGLVKLGFFLPFALTALAMVARLRSEVNQLKQTLIISEARQSVAVDLQEEDLGGMFVGLVDIIDEYGSVC